MKGYDWPDWAPKVLRSRHEELTDPNREPPPRGSHEELKHLAFGNAQLTVLELLLCSTEMQAAWKSIRKATGRMRNASIQEFVGQKAVASVPDEILDLEQLFGAIADALCDECIIAYLGPDKWNSSPDYS